MTVAPRARWPSAVGLAAAVLALVVAAAAATQGVGGLNEAVEAAAGGSGGALGRLASWLPFGFAFGAGMVSAVNPCGFAMLPAYLALYLRGGGDAAQVAQAGLARRLARALLVAASVSVGFLALFALAGLALGAGGRSLAAAFPWLGLATGVALVLAGAWTVRGGQLQSALGERLSHGVATRAGDGIAGYVAFGVAYGLASLSCTLPIFLAVLGSSLTLGDLPGVAAQLAAYGAGMGTVVTVLTLSLALLRHAVVDRARAAVRYVGPIASVTMLAAGAYVVYYWLTLGGLLPRA
jgi:cytochrome c biogenesis protein CcdA